jgi:hypothetical protein
MEATMHAIEQKRTEKTFVRTARSGQVLSQVSGQVTSSRKTMRHSALVFSTGAILLASAIGALAVPALMNRPDPKAQTVTIEFRAFGHSYALVGTLDDPHGLDRLGLSAEALRKRDKL